jgi:hypothetical protein
MSMPKPTMQSVSSRTMSRWPPLTAESSTSMPEMFFSAMLDPWCSSHRTSSRWPQ